MDLKISKTPVSEKWHANQLAPTLIAPQDTVVR